MLNLYHLLEIIVWGFYTLGSFGLDIHRLGINAGILGIMASLGMPLSRANPIGLRI